MPEFKPLPIEQIRANLAKREAEAQIEKEKDARHQYYVKLLKDSQTAPIAKPEKVLPPTTVKPPLEVEQPIFRPLQLKMEPRIVTPAPVFNFARPEKPRPEPKVVPPEMRLTGEQYRNKEKALLAADDELYYQGEITPREYFSRQRKAHDYMIVNHGEPLPIRIPSPAPSRPQSLYRPYVKTDADYVIEAIEANTRAVQQSHRGCR